MACETGSGAGSAFAIATGAPAGAASSATAADFFFVARFAAGSFAVFAEVFLAVAAVVAVLAAFLLGAFFFVAFSSRRSGSFFLLMEILVCRGQAGWPDAVVKRSSDMSLPSGMDGAGGCPCHSSPHGCRCLRVFRRFARAMRWGRTPGAALQNTGSVQTCGVERKDCAAAVRVC